MANIKLNLPGEPFTKQIVTFTAPCGCDQVTDGLVINGETYTVCDAMGECVTGKGGAWIAGAQISVVLDCENKKAFIQNAASPNLKDALNAHINNQNNPHNVTAEQIGAISRNAYVWKRTKVSSGLVVNDSRITTLYSYAWGTTENPATYVYTDSISCDETGTIKFAPNSSGNFPTITIKYAAHTTADTLNGKYCTLSKNITSDGTVTSGTVYYVPSDAAPVQLTLNTQQVTSTSIYMYQKEASTVVWATDRMELSPVFAYDMNAYPINEEVDGIYYEFVGNVESLMTRGARIQTGSYKGTGTYGVDNPCSLTFSFVPKWVQITHFVMDTGTLIPLNQNNLPIINCDWLTTSFMQNAGFRNSSGSAYAKKSEDGKTIDWYNNGGNANYQYNYTGYTYGFIAIG